MSSQADAVREFTQEDWILFAIGLSVTILRTYARFNQVGLKGFQVDDYLVWFAMVIYAAESTLAYSVAAKVNGMANNGMTDEERAALDPNSHEYYLRVVGSKIQIAGWSSYSALLWTLKASLLFFYIRLTTGLDRSYFVRIRVGFGVLLVSYLTGTLTLFLGCRPFHKYWQINPDPGNHCQPGISNPVVWVYCSMNVFSDIYLLSIPVPMLWNSTLKPWKKAGLIFLFSGGIFIIGCGLARAILIVTDPVNGAQLAGSWAVRETFVAVVTTNLPMVFPLVKHVLTPILSSIAKSVKSASERSTDRKRSLVTFGGGGGNQSWRGRGPRTANPITDFTFNESEERILDNNGQVKMQVLTTAQHNATPSGGSHSSVEKKSSTENKIRKDVEFAMTVENGGEQSHRQPAER